MSIRIKKVNDQYQYIEDGVITNDNLKIIECHGRPFIKLPKNPMEIGHISPNKFKDTDEIELTELTKKTRNQSSEPTISTPKSSWLNYLTDEEKAIIEPIIAKCEKRAKMAAIQAQIDALTAQLENIEE